MTSSDTSELLLLIAAIRDQTAAIAKLAASNMALAEAVAHQVGDEPSDDGPLIPQAMSSRK